MLLLLNEFHQRVIESSWKQERCVVLVFFVHKLLKYYWFSGVSQCMWFGSCFHLPWFKWFFFFSQIRWNIRTVKRSDVGFICSHVNKISSCSSVQSRFLKYTICWLKWYGSNTCNSWSQLFQKLNVKWLLANCNTIVIPAALNFQCNLVVFWLYVYNIMKKQLFIGV